MRLALIAKTGEMGYPSVLTAKTWGFYDVLFKGNAFKFQRPYGSYVMEHVLFKISFPAEFHAQTAVECAMQLHPQVAGRLDRIRGYRRGSTLALGLRTSSNNAAKPASAMQKLATKTTS